MTDKERLGFDVNREMKHLKKIVNKDDSLVIKSRFIKYLIEQAERVQELEELEQEYVDLNSDFTKLALENKRYREAIERAIDKLTWNSVESEEILLKALEGESGEQDE